MTWWEADPVASTKPSAPTGSDWWAADPVAGQAPPAPKPEVSWADTAKDVAKIRGLRNALDNGMARSIAPADKVAWDTARSQWGSLKTIERAMAGAGERTAQGFLPPQQLRAAVAGRDPSKYVRGEGELAELARAGAGVMQPLPQSGTAPRAHIMSMPNVIAAGIGGAAGGIPGAIAAHCSPSGSRPNPT